MSLKPQMRDWRDIAKVVRKWLAATDTKQEELALMMGHSDGSELSRYLNGKKPWYPPNLHRVAEIIGVDPAEFYYWPTAGDEFRAGRDAARHIFQRHLDAAMREINGLDYVGAADEQADPIDLTERSADQQKKKNRKRGSG